MPANYKPSISSQARQMRVNREFNFCGNSFVIRPHNLLTIKNKILTLTVFLLCQIINLKAQNIDFNGENRLGFVTVNDSFLVNVEEKGLLMNVDLKLECDQTFKYTGRHTNVNSVLKKFREIVSTEIPYGHYYLGKKSFSFVFKNTTNLDSCFRYWDTIKKIIRPLPDKTLYFQFDTIEHIPANFWEGLGSLKNVSLKINLLRCKFDCSELNSRIERFTYSGKSGCSACKLIVPDSIDELWEWSLSPNLLEMPATDSLYYEWVHVSYNNFIKLRVKVEGLEILDLTLDTTDALIDPYIFNYSNKIWLQSLTQRQKIKVNTDNDFLIKCASIYFAGNHEIDKKFSDKAYFTELSLDTTLMKISGYILFFRTILNSETINQILKFSPNSEFEINMSELTLDNETISLLKKVKKCELKEVKIINNTSFSLPEIKKQLPNCTFN